ncbi:DUF2202 domain-containing protein [Nostocoides sp. F2B08]|uniref:ferritin-like domain-containing protein n=1 Tax=Nostocoides sp. F2B08 TaxID=2653936 RepID=UPI001263556A|nr:DUF2202 domain-containing protein [Tetrasphaera sp. F2B08]KAB7743643.1 DUF2202 domain-containing protein [Tetrasphaera sp. F2B08]
MKTMTRNILVVVSAASLVGLAATAQAVGTAQTTTPAPAVATAAALDPGLAEQLRFTREEERMARDLYAALAIEHDGARPMSRITTSEQRHFDQVGLLLERYGVADPSDGLEAGSYAFPELQSLYDRWLSEGSGSLDAAFQVGIELEERDIADLEAMIEETDQADVRTVLERLLAGSQHHLTTYTMASEGGLPDGTGDGMRYRPGRHNGPMQNGPWGNVGQGGGTGRGPGNGQMLRQSPSDEDGIRPWGPGPSAGLSDCWLRDQLENDDTSE